MTQLPNKTSKKSSNKSLSALDEQEIDELMMGGFTPVPTRFSSDLMSRIESETLAVSVPLYMQFLRALVLITGVGVGLSQALRIMFGVYFLGLLN